MPRRERWKYSTVAWWALYVSSEGKRVSPHWSCETDSWSSEASSVRVRAGIAARSGEGIWHWGVALEEVKVSREIRSDKMLYTNMMRCKFR